WADQSGFPFIFSTFPLGISPAPVILSGAVPLPPLGMRAMPKNAMRQVAVFIQTWGAHGRGVLRGIHRYELDHGRWTVVVRPHMQSDAPAWLRHWKGDGVLASVSHPRFAAALRRLRLPVVNVYYRPDPTFPQLFTDNEVIGRLAADHLHERGLRHFGF